MEFNSRTAPNALTNLKTTFQAVFHKEDKKNKKGTEGNLASGLTKGANAAAPAVAAIYTRDTAFVINKHEESVANTDPQAFRE
ncbi:hypothetical protein HD806DRAFT_533460 [Xylariaceae sp. AK1471]|nr:hypothetical protein HD806DRAFT_533460 [Xylariaceae sp. AK1471]